MDFTVTPARKPKVYEEVVRQIEELIASGALRDGDRLPPERELAQLFKVSRNSVREAVFALENRGLVVSKVGAGTFVRGAEQDLIDPLARAIEQQRQRLHEIFEFRLLLEPQIIGLAALHISGEQLQELEALVATQEARIAEGLPWGDLDSRFHRLIVQASSNQVLCKVFQQLDAILDEVRDETLQTASRARESLATHQRIVEALRRGDPEAASREMEDHLIGVEEAKDRS